MPLSSGAGFPGHSDLVKVVSQTDVLSSGVPWPLRLSQSCFSSSNRCCLVYRMSRAAPDTLIDPPTSDAETVIDSAAPPRGGAAAADDDIDKEEVNPVASAENEGHGQLVEAVSSIFACHYFSEWPGNPAPLSASSPRRNRSELDLPKASVFDLTEEADEPDAEAQGGDSVVDLTEEADEPEPDPPTREDEPDPLLLLLDDRCAPESPRVPLLPIRSASPDYMRDPVYVADETQQQEPTALHDDQWVEYDRMMSCRDGGATCPDHYVRLPRWVEYRHSDRNLHEWLRLDMTNLLGRVESCSQHRNIEWRLQRPFAPQSDWQCHLDCVINEGLRMNQCFKIGITYMPWNRITYADYRHDDRKMIMSLVSDSSELIAAAEENAISRYRPMDRAGQRIEGGDPRCQNRAPGGEGAHHGFSPFFCYVVFGNHHNWRSPHRDRAIKRPRLR